MRMPLRIRFWHGLHAVVNRAAWRWARPDGPNWGIALRIDERRLLWRLNTWTANHWIDWWFEHRHDEDDAGDFGPIAP